MLWWQSIVGLGSSQPIPSRAARPAPDADGGPARRLWWLWRSRSLPPAPKTGCLVFFRPVVREKDEKGLRKLPPPSCTHEVELYNGHRPLVKLELCPATELSFWDSTMRWVMDVDLQPFSSTKCSSHLSSFAQPSYGDGWPWYCRVIQRFANWKMSTC